MNLNETLQVLKSELNEQEEHVNLTNKLLPPEVKDGVAVEIEQDQKTAEKKLHYFIIENGEPKFLKTMPADKNGPHKFYEKAGKYSSMFTHAFEAISKTGERDRFMLYNVKTLDIVGYWQGDDFKIIATGDKGQLQLEWNSNMKKWEKQ